MSKSGNTLKSENTSDTKTDAAYSKKDNPSATASKMNPSKYAPTDDADMNVQALGSRDGLLKLFTDSIKDIYWAENELVKALPKMAISAGSKELSTAIMDHFEQTKNHVERLDAVFELLHRKPQAQKCDAMEGLVKEGEAIVEDTDASTPARDLGIIMSSQKVEHYEMSAYTGLINLANKLGLTEAADLLTETLNEEEESDSKLTILADNIKIDNEEE